MGERILGGNRLAFGIRERILGGDRLGNVRGVK